MKDLHFNVNETVLKAAENQIGITRGSHRFLNLMFSFGREWANYKKVVQVKDTEGNEYNEIITHRGVLLPRKITGTSRLYITVFGKKGETEVKTNTVAIEQL